MKDIEYTDFGGFGPFGSISGHQEQYGEYQVKVVNNILSPVSPDNPVRDGRIYRLVDEFVTHHGTEFELRNRLGKTDHEVVLEKAVEVTADKYSYKPETIKNVYRDLYEQFDAPTEALRDDLGEIADHLEERGPLQ
ncbi:hypothetical protein [Haloarcula halophila]|uniref:hypothetical protein n=1 Tax=Halomicroarcula sp. GCM10025335 TaxID=3252668 RepID=UPI00361BFA1C